ncbi:MAG TPA: STAS domain-containing protein [Polyangium sp.]|nr:STAS domain-containing protein [Polyangium sp.]
MVRPRITDISVETAETLHTLLSTEQQNLVDHVQAVVSNGDRMLAKSLLEALCDSVRQRNGAPLADRMNGTDAHSTHSLLVGLRRSVIEVLGATILQQEHLGSSALHFVMELLDSALYERSMRRFAEATANAADSIMLYDLSCSLVTSSSFEELVEVIMTYLEPFGANSSAILRFDTVAGERENQIVSLLPFDNALARALERAVAPDSPLASLLNTKLAVVIDDVENDSSIEANARNALRDLGVGGILSAPLLLRAELVGRLVVSWPVRTPLHAHVVRTMHALGTQATAVAERLFVMERYQREIEERAALQSNLVDAQQTLLRELGTPIIPVADDVVLMPLVGTIDEARAGRITEVMLSGIVARGAATAILDLSGVPMATARVAEALVGVTRAVRLVGAEVVLTGIRPDMAKTLIEGGELLEGFVIRATVQGGIAFALAKSSARNRRPSRKQG